MPRVLQEPRDNPERTGIKRGGFSLQSGQSVTWYATPANIAKLEDHLNQFLVLATRGPAHCDGQEIRTARAQLHIANPEFEAAIRHIKASLDKLQVPNQEQKELLPILESNRPQIVEKQYRLERRLLITDQWPLTTDHRSVIRRPELT